METSSTSSRPEWVAQPLLGWSGQLVWSTTTAGTSTELAKARGPRGRVHVDTPRSSLCGDTIGFFAGEGHEAIIAFDVEYLGSTIHPAWAETSDLLGPIHGSAGVPADVDTPDELEAAILGSLPDTAGERHVNTVQIAGLLLLFASVATWILKYGASGVPARVRVGD